MTSRPEAVVLTDIRFSYKANCPILRIPSLAIAAGRRIFLHGPSGSGKTTLLSLISGIVTPQQGSVSILGHEFTRLSPAARDTARGSEIGYIFQGFNLIPYLTVRENIALPCELHPSRRRRIAAPDVEQEVHRIAVRLDIHAQLDAPVAELSAGQQQRVAIARAIIGYPPLVIADEPTSSLDSDRRDAFVALLTEVTVEAHATLLFVSHDRSLARHFDETLSLPSVNEVSRTEAA